MKKILTLFALLSLLPVARSATARMQDLPAMTAVTDDDIFWMVNDPGAAPSDRKVTAAVMRTLFASGLGNVVADNVMTNGVMIVGNGTTHVVATNVGTVDTLNSTTINADLVDGPGLTNALYLHTTGPIVNSAGTTNVWGALAGKAPNTFAGITNALGVFDNDVTKFLRADGTMAAPAGGTGSTNITDNGYVAEIRNATITTNLVLSSGAAAWKSLSGNYVPAMNSAAGQVAFTRMTPPFISRRRSWILPGGSSFGSGSFAGEPYTANGTVVLMEATSTLPAYYRFYGASVINSEIGPDAQGWGLYYPGKAIVFTCGFVPESTNVVRWFAGLTATSRDNTIGSDTPNFKLVGFQYSDGRGDTTYKVITSNAGGATQVIDTLVNYTPYVHRTLQLIEDVSGARWLGVIDGTLVSTNDANIPSANKLGSICVTSQLEAVTKTNGVSFIETSSSW